MACRLSRGSDSSLRLMPRDDMGTEVVDGWDAGALGDARAGGVCGGLPLPGRCRWLLEEEVQGGFG